MSQNIPPLLDYATRRTALSSEPLVAMHVWRSITAWSMAPLVLGVAFPMIGIIGAAMVLVGSVMTLFYMTRAAAYEVDRQYACRHLALAILLCPVLLLGVFLVPSLVESDLIRWREDEIQQRRQSLDRH